MYDGTGLNGHRLLPVRSAREMRRVKVRLRRGDPNRLGFGHAWILGQWQGHKVFNHDGGTLGQYSQLVVCPEKRIAVAVLTNGGNAQGVFGDIVGGLLKAQVKIAPPGPPPVDDSVNPVVDELCGRYGNISGRIEVTQTRDGISAMAGPPGHEQTHELQFCSPRLARIPIGLLEFGGQRGEPAAWLRWGSRLYNRVG